MTRWGMVLICLCTVRPGSLAAYEAVRWLKPVSALDTAYTYTEPETTPTNTDEASPSQTHSEAGDHRERVTAPARPQAPVDFNHPPRDYTARRLHDWDVFVETQLVDEAPVLAARALTRLDNTLGKIASLLPASSLSDLRRVRVFVLFGPSSHAGGRENGLEYFQADAPRHWNWLDPRMASSIVIFNAANYATLTDQWALKSLLHEFGHAQHLEHWQEDRAEIYDTWQGAIQRGLYQTVREEDKNSHCPNYAAQNHLEYFAELTTTYFAGNTYFPYNGTELAAYDPAGYALIEKLWGLQNVRWRLSQVCEVGCTPTNRHARRPTCAIARSQFIRPTSSLPLGRIQRFRMPPTAIPPAGNCP